MNDHNSHFSKRPLFIFHMNYNMKIATDTVQLFFNSVLDGLTPS